MIREGIKSHIRERQLNLDEISKETGIEKNRLDRFMNNGREELSIDELEAVAEAVEYSLTPTPQGYVSQAGSHNINIQIVSFGDEGGALVEALAKFVNQINRK